MFRVDRRPTVNLKYAITRLRLVREADEVNIAQRFSAGPSAIDRESAKRITAETRPSARVQVNLKFLCTLPDGRVSAVRLLL